MCNMFLKTIVWSSQYPSIERRKDKNFNFFSVSLGLSRPYSMMFHFEKNSKIHNILSVLTCRVLGDQNMLHLRIKRRKYTAI